MFVPGTSFPSVSVTGAECSLNCRHCAGRYLHGMRPATEPAELLRIATSLESAGATGMLISGGCDGSGKVPLGRFIGAIRRIKQETGLLLNAHVGLSSHDELEDLVSSGVDAFSVDTYGSDSAVRETLRLEAGSGDFLRVIYDLKDLHAPSVVPHICIGVEGGRVSGEFEAISMLKAVAPDSLALIVFTPTKGTPYEGCQPPSSEAILEVIRNARDQHRDARILLGCMRPRKDRSYEVDAVHAGIDGVAMPSRETVERLRSEGFDVRVKPTCCAFG